MSERDDTFIDSPACHEGSVLFMIANFQYLVTCIAFSVGEPFRKAWWTNKPFFISVILILFVDMAVIFLPNESALASFFDIVPIDDYSYRFIVILGIILNSVITFFTEKLIVHGLTRSWDERT